jgi:hypothetical protein
MTAGTRLYLLFVLAIGNIAVVCSHEAEEKQSFSVAAVLVHEQAFDRPHDVELQGDLAFVPGKGGSIAIVDVSQPTEPRLVWHRHDAKGLDDAETVLPAGDRLILGTHDIHVLDLRDPKQPVFEIRLNTRPKISNINGMVRRSDILFAAGKNGVLAAYDVREPSYPKAVAVAKIRDRFDIGWPHDVDLYGPYAVVPDPRRFGRLDERGKLALIQVFDKQTGQPMPTDRWKLAGVVATDELVGANRVQVSGQYAFVGASTSANGGRLIVVDLHNPTSPKQIASLPFAPDDGWGPNGLTVAGDIVFLAGGHSVEAIDVGRPQQPVKLASQRFTGVLKNAYPRYSGGGDSGHDLVYRDGYLYVTGQNDSCLMILRVESNRIRELAESKRKNDEN